MPLQHLLSPTPFLPARLPVSMYYPVLCSYSMPLPALRPAVFLYATALTGNARSSCQLVQGLASRLSDKKCFYALGISSSIRVRRRHTGTGSCYPPRLIAIVGKRFKKGLYVSGSAFRHRMAEAYYDKFCRTYSCDTNLYDHAPFQYILCIHGLA